MNPPKTINILKYLSEDMTVMNPGEDSPEAQFVPGLVEAYGHPSGFLKVLPFIFPKIIKTIRNIKRSYGSLKENPVMEKRIIPPELLQEFEIYARKLGCSNIAYTKVPPNYIFSNKVILFENAIVLTMEMKKSKMKKAPSFTSSREVWHAYAGLGKIVNQLADFLRKHGYASEAGPALGGETNYPYLAQRAGMGLIGKHGILISNDNGI